MAYTFKDFGQKADVISLSVRTIIDGKQLDGMTDVPGFSFTTLTVSGRGATKYSIESVTTFGRPGALQRDRRLEPRSIVIRALVSATTNEAYRKGLAKLNALFYNKKISAIKFTDDMEHTYYGSILRVEDGEEKSNRQIVEIEFLCNDPFKYTDIKTVVVTGATPLVVESDIPVVPETIEIAFADSVAASNFTLMNTVDNTKIVFNQPGSVSTILINQKADFIGALSGTNYISGLNIENSHFDRFKIKNGDVVWAAPAPSTITIKYRGAKL